MPGTHRRVSEHLWEGISRRTVQCLLRRPSVYIRQSGQLTHLRRNQVNNRPRTRRRIRRRWLLPFSAGAVAIAAAGTVITIVAPTAQASIPFQAESLDGSGNNVNHPTWGQAGQPYTPQGTAHYA